ncbi:hypothetical protein MCEMSEM23_01973 [Rhabdaerophilaceae bacterium]
MAQRPLSPILLSSVAVIAFMSAMPVYAKKGPSGGSLDTLDSVGSTIDNLGRPGNPAAFPAAPPPLLAPPPVPPRIGAPPLAPPGYDSVPPLTGTSPVTSPGGTLSSQGTIRSTIDGSVRSNNPSSVPTLPTTLNAPPVPPRVGAPPLAPPGYDTVPPLTGTSPLTSPGGTLNSQGTVRSTIDGSVRSNNPSSVPTLPTTLNAPPVPPRVGPPPPVPPRTADPVSQPGGQNANLPPAQPYQGLQLVPRSPNEAPTPPSGGPGVAGQDRPPFGGVGNGFGTLLQPGTPGQNVRQVPPPDPNRANYVNAPLQPRGLPEPGNQASPAPRTDDPVDMRALMEQRRLQMNPDGSSSGSVPGMSSGQALPDNPANVGRPALPPRPVAPGQINPPPQPGAGNPSASIHNADDMRALMGRRQNPADGDPQNLPSPPPRPGEPDYVDLKLVPDPGRPPFGGVGGGNRPPPRPGEPDYVDLPLAPDPGRPPWGGVPPEEGPFARPAARPPGAVNAAGAPLVLPPPPPPFNPNAAPNGVNPPNRPGDPADMRALMEQRRRQMNPDGDSADSVPGPNANRQRPADAAAAPLALPPPPRPSNPNAQPGDADYQRLPIFPNGRPADAAAAPLALPPPPRPFNPNARPGDADYQRLPIFPNGRPADAAAAPLALPPPPRPFNPNARPGDPDYQSLPANAGEPVRPTRPAPTPNGGQAEPSGIYAPFGFPPNELNNFSGLSRAALPSPLVRPSNAKNRGRAVAAVGGFFAGALVGSGITAVAILLPREEKNDEPSQPGIPGDDNRGELIPKQPGQPGKPANCGPSQTASVAQGVPMARSQQNVVMVLRNSRPTAVSVFDLVDETLVGTLAPGQTIPLQGEPGRRLAMGDESSFDPERLSEFRLIHDSELELLPNRSQGAMAPAQQSNRSAPTQTRLVTLEVVNDRNEPSYSRLAQFYERSQGQRGGFTAFNDIDGSIQGQRPGVQEQRTSERYTWPAGSLFAYSSAQSKNAELTMRYDMKLTLKQRPAPNATAKACP